MDVLQEIYASLSRAVPGMAGMGGCESLFFSFVDQDNSRAGIFRQPGEWPENRPSRMFFGPLARRIRRTARRGELVLLLANLDKSAFYPDSSPLLRGVQLRGVTLWWFPR